MKTKDQVCNRPPPPPRKVLDQGLHFLPQVSCSKFLPKILSYFSELKMKKKQKLAIISLAII